MKSRSLFVGAILWFQLTAFSQTATIGGMVLDAATGEALVGVNILVENTGTGTVTDENGAFALSSLAPGAYTLTFSYLGYARKKLPRLTLQPSQALDLGTIELEEESISLSQVTVTPGSFSIMGEENLSRQTLTARDLKNMSWAEDITRAVARLPGISSSDYSSRFSVRGGEANEVLIALDGMELYDPFHQRDYSGGLFSIVDIETIRGVELMTGGFSAEYGNRLSGVFNMRTKHIAENQSHRSIGLSVMNGRAYADGKFSDNKGTYLVSVRRSMLDLLFRPPALRKTFHPSTMPLRRQNTNSTQNRSSRFMYCRQATSSPFATFPKRAISIRTTPDTTILTPG